KFTPVAGGKLKHCAMPDAASVAAVVVLISVSAEPDTGLLAKSGVCAQAGAAPAPTGSGALDRNCDHADSCGAFSKCGFGKRFSQNAESDAHGNAIKRNNAERT